ncbi:hypothetical protein AAZX31_19G075300 [Glycine max]
MPPSRRKGRKKSNSDAAACQQFKLGDLVLAKVKGFPAWPTMKKFAGIEANEEDCIIPKSEKLVPVQSALMWNP